LRKTGVAEDLVLLGECVDDAVATGIADAGEADEHFIGADGLAVGHNLLSALGLIADSLPAAPNLEARCFTLRRRLGFATQYGPVASRPAVTRIPPCIRRATTTGPATGTRRTTRPRRTTSPRCTAGRGQHIRQTEAAHTLILGRTQAVGTGIGAESNIRQGDTCTGDAVGFPFAGFTRTAHIRVSASALHGAAESIFAAGGQATVVSIAIASAPTTTRGDTSPQQTH